MLCGKRGNRLPEKAAVCKRCGKTTKTVIFVTAVSAVSLTVAGGIFFAGRKDSNDNRVVCCLVDIWQNSAEQGFTGKAPERGDAVSSLSEGNAVRWKPVQGGLAEYQRDSAVVSAETESAEKEAGTESTEILLVNIGWEDYSNNDHTAWDTTKLFFSFSNGETVDLEVLHSPSMVENIEYLDINGDGTDEVLVYRYFANTATEYTLIDFIDVKDGIVKNISPEMDIAELAGEVWNTAIEDFTVDGYAYPVLKMQSFDKVPGLAFEKQSYHVGYKDGRWQIIPDSFL